MFSLQKCWAIKGDCVKKKRTIFSQILKQQKKLLNMWIKSHETYLFLASSTVLNYQDI